MLTQIIEGRKSNVLTIEYMLGNLCNYRCSYCFPGSHEGDHPWPDTDLVIENISHLFDTYKRIGKDKFELYLIGGEPTLWKDLVRLCEYLKKKYDVVIRLSTNGYRKVEWWNDHGHLFDAVEISVHHEFADCDHIINVCDALYNNKINLVANVLMDPNHFDKCRTILEKLKHSKRRWPIVAKWVHLTNGTVTYTDKQKKYLTKPLKRFPNLFWWFGLSYKDRYVTWVVENGIKKRVPDNYFIVNGKNKFQGWLCNLGLDHLNIHKAGRISGNCGQLLFDQNNFYNFYDLDFKNKFKPKIAPTICEQKSCDCGFETNISKVVWIRKI